MGNELSHGNFVLGPYGAKVWRAPDDRIPDLPVMATRSEVLRIQREHDQQLIDDRNAKIANEEIERKHAERRAKRQAERDAIERGQLDLYEAWAARQEAIRYHYEGQARKQKRKRDEGSVATDSTETITRVPFDLQPVKKRSKKRGGVPHCPTCLRPWDGILAD